MTETFIGFFKIEEIEDMEEKQNIILFGIPYEREKDTPGSSLDAPKEIRNQSQEFSGVSANFNINQVKKLFYDIGDINPVEEQEKIKKLWKFVQASDSQLICLGGDHSITYDTLALAPFDEETAIIWIDAHADLADEYPPGVFRSHGTVFTNLKLKQMLEPSQMLLIGGHAYTQTKEEYEKKFGFLLGAFKYGPPPHGGIAFGIDRLITLFTGDASIREVIPFPKTQKGVCPLTEAPASVDNMQLRELGIKLSKTAKKE